MSEPTIHDQNLLDAALKVRENAAAIYSGFNVGAALLDSEGKTWTGCNVESSSYGLSCCAERTALFKAISEGVRSFDKIAIVAGGHGVATPCGACRQVLHDYAPDLKIILHNPETNESRSMPLSELLPYAFSEANLKGTGK